MTAKTFLPKKGNYRDLIAFQKTLSKTEASANKCIKPALTSATKKIFFLRGNVTF